MQYSQEPGGPYREIPETNGTAHRGFELCASDPVADFGVLYLQAEGSAPVDEHTVPAWLKVEKLSGPPGVQRCALRLSGKDLDPQSPNTAYLSFAGKPLTLYVTIESVESDPTEPASLARVESPDEEARGAERGPQQQKSPDRSPEPVTVPVKLPQPIEVESPADGAGERWPMTHLAQSPQPIKVEPPKRTGPPPPVPVAPVMNVSGQPGAVLPVELRGLNWGAFLLNWIWAIRHKAWLGFALSFFCGIIGAIYLLIKGNEDAWKYRRFSSVEEFKQVQSAWLIWGLIACGIGIMFYVSQMSKTAAKPRAENTTKPTVTSGSPPTRLATPVPTPPSQPLAVSNQILYVSRRSKWYNIFLFDPSTGKERQLTSGEYNDCPWPSPDHKKIVYESKRGNIPGKGYDLDIVVLDLQTLQETGIARSASKEAMPCWSPDGSTIFFQSDATGSEEIYAYSLRTASATRITNLRGHARMPAVSPDGKRIAFTFSPLADQKKQNSHIQVINADGTGLQSVTSGDCRDDTPMWSSAGDRIAFVSNRGDRSRTSTDIYVVGSRGGEPVRWTNTFANTGSPSWSGDDHFLIFSSDMAGKKFAIYRLDTRNIRLERVILNNYDNITCFWVP